MTKAIFVGLATAATALAQTATVVIEASHGGAGSDLTNTTITVPLNTRYTNSALQVVSTFYLTGANGVDVDSITCTPYRYSNLTGMGGLPFTSTKPSFLSTNTVSVGSLLCKSTESTTSSSTSSSSSSASTSSSSTPVVIPMSSTSQQTSSSSASQSVTSTISGTRTMSSSSTTSSGDVTDTSVPVVMTTSFSTVPAMGPGQGGPSTITSVAIVPASNKPTQSNTESGSPSMVSPSLNTNAAAGVVRGDLMAHGVAIAGVGLLMAM